MKLDNNQKAIQDLEAWFIGGVTLPEVVLYKGGDQQDYFMVDGDGLPIDITAVVYDFSQTQLSSADEVDILDEQKRTFSQKWNEFKVKFIKGATQVTMGILIGGATIAIGVYVLKLTLVTAIAIGTLSIAFKYLSPELPSIYCRFKFSIGACLGFRQNHTAPAG